MAKEEEKKAPIQDKGKGKADDAKPANGEKGEKTDGKDGKKDNDLDLAPEELSEEDQKLKDELDMLVERLTEDDKSLYKAALEAIKESIKTSTSSMTAVPKPLKFLRPHYEKLCEAYEKWPAGDEKLSLADTLSVLGMTYSDEERLDTLKYRLLAPNKDIGSWGHEYMRHLALEIGSEYQNRMEKDADTDDINDLTRVLVPFFLSHNAEADAVVLLGHEHRQPALFADALPQVGRDAVCRVRAEHRELVRLPDLARAEAVPQVGADRVLQGALLVGEREAHGRASLPGEAEHALGDDVALDLRGAAPDRAGAGPERAGGLLLQRQAGLREVFLMATGRAAKTFPARWPLLALDRIYVRHARSAQPLVLPARPWSRLSDHAPLAAQVQW